MPRENPRVSWLIALHEAGLPHIIASEDGDAKRVLTVERKVLPSGLARKPVNVFTQTNRAR
jgi:hypothetical protein